MWLVLTNRELKFTSFLTLWFVQTLSDPKVIDIIKRGLFGATTITRKTILENGLVIVDDVSGSGAAFGANDAPLIVFKTTNYYDYDHTGYTDFATSIKYSAYKCQECKAKHDRMINAINVLTTSVKKIISKRGVIPYKKISYLYTPLEIKVAKRRRKEISKASSSIEKSKNATPMSLSYTFDQCTKSKGEQHDMKNINVDVIIEDTTEQYNITVDNPSTASKEEEKMEPFSSGEWKNYPFEGFDISNEAPKELTKLINDYSEWIADGLLKHHAVRYYQQHPKVSQNEECLINIIKVFSISDGLPWHLVDKVYIPINCGDEFHWVLAVVILKERRIQVYDSML
ncbi:hypothetical protein BC332_21282 [Capsicum chinense]|nr:hypothetical protein BC332_21282 [Capsicum chinense]